MFKKYVSFSTLTLCVGMSMATMASAQDFSHELQGLISDPAQLTTVINSPTMNAATQFCQLAVLGAHQVNALEDQVLAQLNAHCIVGDFHTVGHMLGADLTKPFTGQYDYSNGVSKYLNADEQSAIDALQNIQF